MNLEDKLILINGNKYIIIETVDYDAKKYAYLVNNKNQLDSMFKEIIIGKKVELKDIDSNLFVKNIYPLFFEKFKNY